MTTAEQLLRHLGLPAGCGHLGTHRQHSEEPSETDKPRAGRHCGPWCDLWEPLTDEDDEPDDGLVLIAGVLYDKETGYEAEDDDPDPADRANFYARSEHGPDRDPERAALIDAGRGSLLP